MLHMLLNPSDLAGRIDLPTAIDALGAALRAPQLPQTPPRSHIGGPRGDLLVMPAYGHAGAGVKILGIRTSHADPARRLSTINGIYVLFDPGDLSPKLILDGSALTQLRTSTRNAIQRSVRCRGERGFALLIGRWRTLQYITASPSKIGAIARAALVLTHFEHGYIT
jgi:ornithine cyclodeaminase/alanine dehydrogenase-like protein (mu-crystallin family)